MVFKNRAESAQLLSQRIREEVGADFTLTYISPDSQAFAQFVAQNLNSKLTFFPNSRFANSLIRKFIIIDDGSTSSQEYNEFTDKIRRASPQTKIIVAIPVIPESEKSQLEANCDTLLYLHADPYFFSINQFYEDNSPNS